MQRPRVLFLASLVACVVALGSCAGDEPDEPAIETATREDALSACVAYSEARCRKVASCRGEGETSVDGCISSSAERCADQVDEVECWGGLRDGYEQCLDIEDIACDELCGDPDGLCLHSCTFVCDEAVAPIDG
jgi:hypothetical protein